MTGMSPAGELERSDALAFSSPFTRVNYHFGMLLGVDDFETQVDYQRGKLRLHNAWLHGAGVWWGFGVEAELDTGELRVRTGLANDDAGRELHLDADACLSVPAWFAAHQDELDVTEAGEERRFDAHVVVRHRACLSRPVPAFAEPCEGARTDTAFSRVLESVELRLVPGPAPARVDRYHRLRLLFGLAEPQQEGGAVTPADQEVLDALDALPSAGRGPALLAAFRRFAALDGIDLHPPAAPDGEPLTAFPAGDDAAVTLADVHVVLRQEAAGLVLADAEIDPAVRPSHVATSTIQELTCGAAGTDADGPRVNRDSVTLDTTNLTLTFELSAELAPESVSSAAFALAEFTTGAQPGWADVAFQDPPAYAPSAGGAAPSVTLRLGAAPSGTILRLIARGTGTAPLLGTDLVPLAGALAGPPGSAHDGHDFVHMLKES